jgi:hypothetical protein
MAEAECEPGAEGTCGALDAAMREDFAEVAGRFAADLPGHPIAQAVAAAESEAAVKITAALDALFPEDPRIAAFVKVLRAGVACDVAEQIAAMIPQAPAQTRQAPSSKDRLLAKREPNCCARPSQEPPDHGTTKRTAHELQSDQALDSRRGL